VLSTGTHLLSDGDQEGESACALMISGRYLITPTAPSIILALAASVFEIYCPLQQNLSPASGALARYR